MHVTVATPWSLGTPTLRRESLVCFWGVGTAQGVRENPFPSSFPWKVSLELLWRAHLPTRKASRTGSTKQMIPSHLHATD